MMEKNFIQMDNMKAQYIRPYIKVTRMHSSTTLAGLSTDDEERGPQSAKGFGLFDDDEEKPTHKGVWDDDY